MKYIGPFLRLNSLNKENIKNQLFHLSKESMKNIIFNSKCGIEINTKELKNKRFTDLNTNILKSSYPILCVYKKSNPKLKNINDKFYWNGEKIKKEINIPTNAFMTLALLELADYYNIFKDKDDSKYALSIIYKELAKKQLQFYASYLRNEEGVFIDKIDTTDSSLNEFKLEIKNNKFKFSDQALLMAAFYKCYLLDDSKDGINYRNFSFDIMNMFIEFKQDLYSLSFEELLKLSLGLNIFYKFSNKEDTNLLLIDLFELIGENYFSNIEISTGIKLENLCLYYINCFLLYKNTGFIIYKETADKLHVELLKFYNDELGIFVKVGEKDPYKFSSSEICLYVLSLMLHNDDSSLPMLTSIFKKQLVNSGIILSWPDAPTLDDIERYKNFSLSSEDLLEEKNFKLPSIPSPENIELAPIFIKNINFNEKKHVFKQGKTSFYSNRNIPIFFFTIYLYNNCYL
ncbi:hypothetical protein BD780_003190 [Clostridium tetanomorphum]|uniref:Uncharacterized protein n=1 Tax=Clostridium tetanomorphum TaxID=1553 RepID=A0A923J393_CLOTT|nr:hypothetical protein [Clostridium tetanomorphum]KAJ52882.1 hypothetical protein CTM_05287 [Clostridium tetanomorphum DSM 665]MBC2399908.1 hypothetical protein [Clostridium tetanomorphum]MBP1865981.1 hypothetical protein [Clostridium tetanomorphum]NRS85965.1 hypothetical protein [Clostridium tetanomorphum]NRZ96025.1 hypothetical protein [Clostridium tetanomorphum]